MSIQYKIPEYVHVSQDCRQLLSRIFVANPAKVLLYLNSDQLTRPIHDFFLKKKIIPKLHTENNNKGDQEPPMVPEEPAKRAHRSCTGNVLQKG